MNSIHVKLLGNPEVYVGNKKIIFPFKKVEALFYYLVVNKRASRDELVSLLWGDIEEEISKKNLRNAIYRIRKTFDIDVLYSPSRSLIMINSDVDITSDVDCFKNEGEKWREKYSEEFLKGFSVKDAQGFEEWMIFKREEYRNLYISSLYSKIKEDIEKGDYDSGELTARRLIAVDEFDERAYRVLMKLCIKKRNLNKAIEVFNKLTEKLKSDMGILPDSKTTELYKKVINLKNSSETGIKALHEEFFYGRHKELNILKESCKNFINNKPYKSAIILGEAGIGKTRIKERLIKDILKNDVYLFETSCYQAEKEYILKPWNAIFLKLAEVIKEDKIEVPEVSGSIVSYLFPSLYTESLRLNLDFKDNIESIRYQASEEAVANIIKNVSNTKKVVFIIEDLQWIDSMSLSMLNNLILHGDNTNIFFIVTCRDGYGRDVDRFITTLIKYNKIEKVILRRFSNDEVREFVIEALPEHEIPLEISGRIYEETEGNTFFILEYLSSIKENRDINIMSSKAQDILKSRFLDISTEARKLLDIVSLFFNAAPLDILRELSGKDELGIIDIFEELESRSIIVEIDEDEEISFRFTHQKLRDYIYGQQSTAKKRLLHNRIGKILEKKLKNNKSDVILFSNLIFHFLRGGNKLAALKYSIRNLCFYLDLSHELFPVAYDINIEEQKNLHISTEETVKQLNSIEKLINGLKGMETDVQNLYECEMAFLHMKGRFLIREGEYEKGVSCIRMLIEISLEQNQVDYLLKGYRQMINYCIQVHSTGLMKEYLDKALDISKKIGNHYETGTILRLKGLNKIMIGEKQEAEQLLKESIEIFNSISKSGDKYYLNIAGAYNYIGEIRRHDMKFSSALKYYDKAIAACEGKNTLTGLTVFYANAGQAAFEMGDYLTSEQYFEKALKTYEYLESSWGRSIAEGYKALLKVKEGNFNMALSHLKRADYFSEKMKSPHEMGIIYRVKAEIRLLMERNSMANNTFKDYVNLDVISYCDKGIELLENSGEEYEVDILKVIKRAYCQ
jgi:DNA-binding SARP family transcriptional activator/predicted ATPase